MATGITIAGRGSLRIDGVIYNAQKIAITFGTEKRTKMVGLGGVAGDKVEQVAPKLEATIIVTADVSVAALSLLSNTVVSAQMADGRSYILEGASTMDQLKHTAEDGTLDIAFEALACMEV